MQPALSKHTGQQYNASIPDDGEVREQLERILSSPEFLTSRRLVDFLRFVTDRTLAGEARTIKQYTIGLEVYRRDSSFDPKADPLIRIEAGRLRRVLKKYYNSRGAQDPVLIQIPLGTYVPRFTVASAAKIEPEVQVEPTNTALSVALQPPLVAVFPFENLGDEAHAYLINGIGEELTAELSRCSGVRVLAFSSAVRSLERSKKICENASSMGVDFVLTGTLRKSDDRIRINVQLLDVKSREQLWSERFQEPLEPTRLFDIEDRIVRKVLGQIADVFGVIQRTMKLRTEARRVSTLSAYEATLRCLHYNLTLSAEAYLESRMALEHASQVEPNSAIVWAMLSQIYLDARALGYEEIPDALKSGIHFASRAVSLDPGCQHAQHAKAFASLIERDRSAMITAAERMVAINLNAASMVASAGFWLCLAGEYKRGMELFRKGIELNPLFPPWLQAAPYFYHMHKGDYEQALHHANEFGLPDFFWSALMQAASLGLLGRVTDARTAYGRLLELKPDFSDNMRDYVRFYVLDDALEERMIEGLEIAM